MMSLDMDNEMRTINPPRLDKQFNSKFPEAFSDQQTPM